MTTWLTIDELEEIIFRPADKEQKAQEETPQTLNGRFQEASGPPTLEQRISPWTNAAGEYRPWNTVREELTSEGLSDNDLATIRLALFFAVSRSIYTLAYLKEVKRGYVAETLRLRPKGNPQKPFGLEIAECSSDLRTNHKKTDQENSAKIITEARETFRSRIEDIIKNSRKDLLKTEKPAPAAVIAQKLG